MSIPEMLLIGLLAIIGYMTVIWLISLATTNSGIVDVFWGPGFAFAAWIYYFLTPDGAPLRKLILVIIVTLWAARLGIYLGWRNIGKPEDYRYQNWRKASGANWWWSSFFKVFLLQGVLLWIIATPLLVAQASPTPAELTVFDILGIILWAVGLFFEAVGDWQLLQFKADPSNKGKVLRTGLWKYTRHPNYFGDACLWWGFFLIALSVPGGFLTIFSPIMMTGLLMRVSGVALLERSLKKNKPEYADYIANTNAFFPWFPRKSSGG